jgi:hypothetical protein
MPNSIANARRLGSTILSGLSIICSVPACAHTCKLSSCIRNSEREGENGNSTPLCGQRGAAQTLGRVGHYRGSQSIVLSGPFWKSFFCEKASLRALYLPFIGTFTVGSGDKIRTSTGNLLCNTSPHFRTCEGITVITAMRMIKHNSLNSFILQVLQTPRQRSFRHHASRAKSCSSSVRVKQKQFC